MSNDLEIIKGDDTTIDFTFTDENGLPVDLTNVTLFFTAKEDYNDTDANAKISKTVASGLHTMPASGLSAVSLSSSDTDIDSGDYYWDIQLKYGDGTINSVKYGKLIVFPDITERTT